MHTTDSDPVTAAVLDLSRTLMALPSVTPDDAGCQELLAARLTPLGFACEWFDAGGVRNLWASRGSGSPHLLFAGHTDVVPSGPAEAWSSPPFEPTVAEGYLRGRGAADMKTSLAAMVVAMEQLLEASPDTLKGTISFLITSDEEGDAVHGTRYAIEKLLERDIRPDFCVVGEPSSSRTVGDVVRCGRRGSLNATLTVHGVQGHVAYPDDAENPVHEALAALSELIAKRWDEGDDYYPPTSLQCSNINAGTGATNVIPRDMTVQFNLRFNTQQTAAGIQAAVAAIFASHDLNYSIDWQLSGEPFLTERGALTTAVCGAIEAATGQTPELSTSGGTSDGRFISPWGEPGSNRVEVVELGPTNATIHKVDECIDIAELAPLTSMYREITRRLLT